MATKRKQFEIFTGTRTITFALEEDTLLFVAEPVHPEHQADEDELICRALDNPIGSPPVEELIKPGSSVAIIVDDATRPTPCARLLPYLLERVEKRTDNIAIFTAPGTHRPMTEQELVEKIGQPVMNRYPVHNLDYADQSAYEYLTTTELGTPVEIHRQILNADHIITLGNIVPHVVVGWSGGAKTIQPGVSGRRTTDFTHWIGAARDNTMDICGNLDCTCRREIDEIGDKVNLCFIMNTVLGEHREILGLFCGNPITAHRKGVQMAEQTLRPLIPAQADILIINAYPAHADFWQGFKPFAYAQFGVRKGGVIIFVFDAPEGLCGNAPSHIPAMEACFPMKIEDIIQAVETGEVTDRVGATNAINHHKIIDRASVICVSEGLSDQECELLRFNRADTVEEALRIARASLGAAATVGVIPFGGDTLVRDVASKGFSINSNEQGEQ